MGRLSSRTVRSPHKHRWEWIFEYLWAHLNEFDRLLHTDAFDVYFQGDAFGTAVPKDVLYVVSESRPIGTCPVNSQWVLKCFGKAGLEIVKRRHILCSGSVIGGARHFLELVKEMVNTSEWDDCWQKAHDQGAFNYLFWSKLSGRIPHRIMGCESDFLTMGYCAAGQQRFFDRRKRIVTARLGRRPVYVHQYNRYREVDREIQRKSGIFINRTDEIAQAQGTEKERQTLG
jgi:hypothetical protein